MLYCSESGHSGCSCWLPVVCVIGFLWVYDVWWCTCKIDSYLFIRTYSSTVRLTLSEHAWSSLVQLVLLCRWDIGVVRYTRYVGYTIRYASLVAFYLHAAIASLFDACCHTIACHMRPWQHRVLKYFVIKCILWHYACVCCTLGHWRWQYMHGVYLVACPTTPVLAIGEFTQFNLLNASQFSKLSSVNCQWPGSLWQGLNSACRLAMPYRQ